MINEYTRLVAYSKHSDFRKHVCKVFEQLHNVTCITFEDIVVWLQTPVTEWNEEINTKLSMNHTNLRLYDFKYPCDLILLKDKFAFVSDSHMKSYYVILRRGCYYDTITIKPYVDVNYLTFTIYDLVCSFSCDFDGTYNVIKDIIVEGGINLK